MSDVLEFVLKLKDMMSGGIQKTAATTRSAFGGIDKTISGTQKGLNDLGKGVKLNVDSSGIQNAAREVDKLKSSMNGIGSGGSIAGGVFKGGMAVEGIRMAGRAVGDIGRSALEAGMDAEQQIIALTTFVGKEKAKAIYADLQKSSALTPFTTANILPGVQQLISTGQTPEKAKKDIWSLMNALSATGNAGNQFMLELTESHLAQMASVGTANAFFMKEFQRTAHIPMTRLLAEELFPKNVAGGMKKVAAWSESGELKDHVTYDQFVGALEKASKAGGMFAGALEAQSQTIKGKSSTIKDWWNIGLAKSILDPRTHDNIVQLEDKLISGLTKFPELIGEMSPVINKVFDEFNELWPSVKDFGGSLMDIIKPIGAFALSDDFKNLSKNVLDLSSAILTAIKPITDLAGSALQGAAAIIAKQLGKGKNTFNYVFDHDQYERDNDPSIKTSTRTGYMWGTLPVGMKGIVDSSMMKHVTDSLGANNFFADKKSMDDWQNGFMKKYYPKTAFEQIILPLPSKIAEAVSKGKSNGAGGGDADASDAIVGGGPKQTILNFNAPLYKVEKQVFESIKDAIQDFEPRVKDALLKILYGLPAH